MVDPRATHFSRAGPLADIASIYVWAAYYFSSLIHLLYTYKKCEQLEIGYLPATISDRRLESLRNRERVNLQSSYTDVLISAA